MRGRRGSFRGSRGGRGAQGGRGGRGSGSFGDRRRGEDDRIQEPRASAPRRGQLFEGEEKWQRKVREKKARSSSARESEEAPDDDPEEAGRGYLHPTDEDPEESEGEQQGGVEVWRRKKIGWLCKEIPALRPTGIVTMLNAQRKWIKAVDTKEVVETLVRRDEILRAHRVCFFLESKFY
jgi:hypothetical protein